MTTKIWKIGLVPALLLSVVYANTTPYSYSWQERPRGSWEDFNPMLDFQSQRVGSNDEGPSYQKLLAENAPPAPLPTYIRHPGSHIYPLAPGFGNPGTKYISNHYNRNEVTNIIGEVDVSRERMGGFGGTGDVLGYGAYEYKSNRAATLQTPYTDILRMPKSRGTFVDKFLDDHPLQNL